MFVVTKKSVVSSFSCDKHYKHLAMNQSCPLCDITSADCKVVYLFKLSFKASGLIIGTICIDNH